MAPRRWILAGLTLLSAVAVSSPGPLLRLNGLHPVVSAGAAHLVVVGTRSVAQRQSGANSKLDSMLSDLVRHASLARPDHLLADLHAISPAARFYEAPGSSTALVLIDATAKGDPQQLQSALLGLGLQHAAVYANDVGGYLPVAQIETATARTELLSLRAAMPRTHAVGPVATQGDYAQRSDVVRSDYPTLTGSGITVGILSDSFNCYAVYAQPGSGVPVSGYEGYAFNGFTADYASDMASGALPSGVNVAEEATCLDYGAPIQPPFTDEGRAMLQIVHAVAPAADLAFYTGTNSEADFANGIGVLANAGAKVIADDLGYADEPFFQDGILAQAVNAAEANGAAYFSAAGNDGSTSWQSTAPSFSTLASSGSNSGEYLLDFAASGATTATALPITIPAIPPGDFVFIVVEWDQPYVTGAPGSPGASSQIDVCITGGTGSDIIMDYDGNAVSCSGPNATGVDPYQVMIIGNPANAAGNTTSQNLNIQVGLADGSVAPGRVIVAVEDDGLGSTINAYDSTGGPTLQGHPGAAGAAAVGAAFYFETPRCGTTPAQLETFSSQGGAPILFDTSGNRLATAQVRQKPDFVGPDGVNDTFLGFTLASAGVTGNDGLLSNASSECQNNPAYPNFFGTSAATPHAAGIATLIMQANPSTTPSQIYAAMQGSALAMSGATPNFNSGYGFIQADAALALIAPGPPTLTLAENSVTVGTATNLTWSSVNATSCSASGAWSGSLAASGMQSVTATAVGSSTYTITCANAAGTSAATSVSLTAAAAAPVSTGHSGGGAFGGAELLALTLMGLARTRRRGALREDPSGGRGTSYSLARDAKEK
jgi:Subtilase family